MKTISRYIMTLALLLTAVTGAWAQEDPEGTPTVSVSDLKYEGGLYFYEVTATVKQAYGIDTEVKYTTDGTTPTPSSPAYTGPIKCYKNQTVKFQAFIMGTPVPGAAKDATITFSFEGPTITVDGAKVTISTNLNNATTYYKLNGGDAVEGTEVTLTQSATVTAYVVVTNGTYANFTSSESSKEVALQDESDAIEVTWDASTKTGTFTMPAFDVVLTPIYAKAAAFATTGTEPDVKTLLPEATEGVIAGTDASLIAEGTGIVAFAGTSTEVTQGTLMYAIGTSATEAPALSAFSATVPTAENVADDGGNVYVWYYIQGADAPDGVAATLDNTFDDSEICTTPLTVQVLTNKFDITFKAANANTIEAGMATVTVGGTAATVTEGKLQGVKMGSEVKLKANTGYKFRKVEVKKKGAEKTIKIDGQDYTVLNGETWKQFITRNQLSGWYVQPSLDTTWRVYMEGSDLFVLLVSTDGTTWNLLKLTSEDAPIDTDKQYKWGE